ncbi:hypothetical protein [Bacteroides sp. 224]|uniref:hypothetical protein n=1 Tax=Bacteroides sp. 224 TaxID=2302936 RepID=UPI0013D0F901|nr:hypothetical protein [Bacteroides sp. 224]NDV63899.1 hypothetical protein [Bacteroides sp. 224]
MVSSKTKTITKFYVSIGGKEVAFRTKETAIKVGKMALKTNSDIKLIEEYLLWDITPGIPAQLIDKQRFDRTILISL